MGRDVLLILCFLSFSSIFSFDSHSYDDIQVISSVVTEEATEYETDESLDGLQIELQEESVMIEENATLLPEEVEVNLKYDKYFINYDYVVVINDVNIREAPSLSGKVIRTATSFEKINLYETVKGEYIEKYKSDVWYHVYWWNGEDKQFGFILAPLVEMRRFQFDKMYSEIEKVTSEFKKGKLTFINNYKNGAGYAPLYKGTEKDKYGTRRSQSAPGYFDLSDKENFAYIEDGTLVRIIDSTDEYYKVYVLHRGLQCWVPKKYMKSKNLSEVKKIVIIDRNNQNEGVFEYINGKWVLVSYTLATTGERAQHKIETALGYFYAIEKKAKFLYLDDETKEIAGYAPYAIRFSGGTYIHGIPVNYTIKEEKKIDPGHIEYTATIGTTPRSHRCVRNYTSHAKFLYDWVEIGKTVIIVIE
ncbi:MAG: L,D-transpeptidase family protein [Clostridiales bacterium]|nr:L,D-transpeptidase family protein [Clostridiales bacterium]